MPKVSVCIPAYNQVKYLRKTIDSVLAQTFTDYEIVITDDSATDNVKNFVSTYQRDDIIKYYKNPLKLGTPENWNEAIRKSSGDYIKILHHDDWLNYDDSLAKYVALLDDNPEVDFAFSATQAKFPGGENWVHRISSADVSKIEENVLNLYTGILIGSPSATIYKKKTGLFFDVNLKWIVDIEFYIRQICINKKVAYSTDLLVVTYGADGRVSEECMNNKQVEVFEYFYSLEAIYKSKERYSQRSLNDCVVTALKICNKYKIKSYEEIRESGFKGRISFKIGLYFKLNNAVPFMGRYFIKALSRF